MMSALQCFVCYCNTELWETLHAGVSLNIRCDTNALQFYTTNTICETISIENNDWPNPLIIIISTKFWDKLPSIDCKGSKYKWVTKLVFNLVKVVAWENHNIMYDKIPNILSGIHNMSYQRLKDVENMFLWSWFKHLSRS